MGRTEPLVFRFRAKNVRWVRLNHDPSIPKSHSMTTANPYKFPWSNPCQDVWEVQHPNIWEEAKSREIVARIFKAGRDYFWTARIRDKDYNLTYEWTMLEKVDSHDNATRLCERFMLGQLPPLPDDFCNWKHLNGGTFREPRPGENYINANSINPLLHPEGIKPFIMNCVEGVQLDPGIPTKCRWIVVPT